MPEYLAPGVYIEEFEIGAKPIEGVSTSTTGFLGQTERGPIRPTLITGFTQFERVFGGFLSNSYLTYAVDGFFRNGGKRCYIARITSDDDDTASASLDSGRIRIDAIGPGTWGNRIAVKIEDANLSDRNSDLFKLTVIYWKEAPPTPIVDPTVFANRTDTNYRKPAVVEVYDNLSPDPTSSGYYKAQVNGISDLVTLTREEVGRPDNVANLTLLDNGDDGVAIDLDDYMGDEIPELVEDNGVTLETLVYHTGFEGLTKIEDISIVCVPDENSITGLTGAMVDHCELLKYRFAILQANQSDTNFANLQPPRDSQYAAFYNPWIKVLDPLTNTLKLIPPGGHIAGIYARSDTERGVHKAPANEIVRGALDLQLTIAKGDQDILNPRGVNCIREFTGRGIRVWGARTTSSDPLWKYLNIRRLFIFLEASIDRGMQWVVFEPNDQRLWGRVRATITQFLTGVWKDGALFGSTPEEAFFVKCDETTMTQSDIDNGKLIVIIGVSPVKPAEFVIFRIAQWTAGSEME